MSTLQSRNKVHELLGGGVAITFGAEPLRTATLKMLFESETAAAAAETFLRDGFVFQLTDTSVSTTDMYFTIAGRITRELDMDSAATWTVEADIQEVLP